MLLRIGKIPGDGLGELFRHVEGLEYLSSSMLGMAAS